ncbi:MAG: glutathione S-transferase N-terminal domain-containing protein [Pseudomonadota bacterium]
MKLTDYPITQKWAPTRPDVIQLYAFPTPNGVKASIMLEETGLEYEPHLITLADADVKSPEFLSLNPNNKIPAIIDPNGPGGDAMGLFESGAILIYMADKSGMLLPKDGAKRYETLQWLMFQMGGVGPMFGQLGFFYKFAGKDIEDPRPRDRYIAEAARLLNVIEGQLEGRDWLTGEYSIADIATAPWIRTVRDFYEAGEVTGLDNMTNVQAYIDRFVARPAVQVGLNTPARPS